MRPSLPSFPPVVASVDAWSAAIDDYEPSVKPGKQTFLGLSTKPWAVYLAQLHIAVHPIFSDTFIESLASLPATDPMNDQKLVTRIEIVINREGGIARMGVVKSSGVKRFDAGVLESIHRAEPFPKPPVEILATTSKATCSGSSIEATCAVRAPTRIRTCWSPERRSARLVADGQCVTADVVGDRGH